MSRDQKPRPVKAVTVAGSVSAPDSPNVEAETGEATVRSGDGAKDNETADKQGLPLFTALLFLAACAAGGGGAAALPHFAPGLLPLPAPQQE